MPRVVAWRRAAPEYGATCKLTQRSGGRSIEIARNAPRFAAKKKLRCAPCPAVTRAHSEVHACRLARTPYTDTRRRKPDKRLSKTVCVCCGAGGFLNGQQVAVCAASLTRSVMSASMGLRQQKELACTEKSDAQSARINRACPSLSRTEPAQVPAAVSARLGTRLGWAWGGPMGQSDA